MFTPYILADVHPYRTVSRDYGRKCSNILENCSSEIPIVLL